MFNIFQKQFDNAVHYKKTFESESGRIVLADLVAHVRLMSSSFDENPRQHAYNEGQKEPIRKILELLNVDFKEAEKLLEEHKRHNQKYNKGRN